MKILIVLNQTDARLPVDEHDFLIGVDGGCRWCIEHNLPMDLAIGDFDSLTKSELRTLVSANVDIERYPRDKDHTDLELALSAAMKKNPLELTVYGTWGGRIDHSLGNLLCIATQSNQCPVMLRAKNQSGYLIKNRQKIRITTEIGQRISMLALVCDCTGVFNRGFKFPLMNATIKPGTGIGLSNLSTEPECEISLDSGILLILTDAQCAARIIPAA